MTGEGPIRGGHRDVGALLDAMVGAWGSVGTDLRPRLPAGRQPAAVREQFSAIGIDPVPELVALYSWREPEGPPGLFWEADLLGIGAAVAVWRQHRSVMAGDDEWERQAVEQRAWPGPPTWFPALVGVGVSSDCLMVDNGAGPDRGSLWWVMPQDDSRKVFESLPEALEAALYCVTGGLWTQAGSLVECARTHQAWPHDRVHPPWCDGHH